MSWNFLKLYPSRLCLLAALVLPVCTGAAGAATLCVNPGGTGGCYSTISAAVAAASARDEIDVAPGTYTEDVVITKPLSLIGRDRTTTIIDATGQSNGIYIDGLDAPGLSSVVVRGFTVQHANYEGILVQNASGVTIFRNIVQNNDLWLNGTAGTCPGIAAFETEEQQDCGEGIHLMGADHSTVASNIVQNNSGGILITDETAVSRDNVIGGNTVQNNAWACGITMASHPGYVRIGTAPLAFGIYHTTVVGNTSEHNGTSGSGGAGVGIFAPGPGNISDDNTVVDNQLLNNGQSGVAIHNHVSFGAGGPPNPELSNNAIIGNHITANGPDPAVGTTMPTGISVLGMAPVTGLVIGGNIIEQEKIDIAVNTPSSVEAHLNDLEGSYIGVENLNGLGSVDATENWWGCAAGPSAYPTCSTIYGPLIYWSPWLKNTAR